MRWLPIALVGALALGGCTASFEPERRPKAAPVADSSVAQPPAAHPPVAQPQVAEPTAVEPADALPATAAGSARSRLATEPSESQHPLAHFHRALRALERGKRADHVRILWLGDSHAQADFWTDAIRKGLQKRFGNGGPGFVHLGMRGYRHADVEIDISGRWRMRPKAPSTVERWGDGAFGLGGVLNAGFAGRRTVILRLDDPSLASAPLRYDLCYKHGLEQDRFRLTLGSAAQEEIAAGSKDDLGAIRHLELETEGPATLEVRVADGRPDFCGVVIEADPATAPGVVLDNIGINGARYATALAWDEKAWALEVERRHPELFIFEYGGNEAGDLVILPKKYKAEALEVIARAKRIVPEASCMVVGPSDRMDAESKIPHIVAAMEEAASESGCMFWNTYEVMGGRGSLRLWRDTARASEDGIHLKPKGYAELGALLLGDLMDQYRR